MGLFDALLTQEASVEEYAGYRDGEETYLPARVRPCRLQRGELLSRAGKGASGDIDQVTATARMYCTGEPFPPRSRVTVDGKTMTVVSCYRATGLGLHHLEVTLV